MKIKPRILFFIGVCFIFTVVNAAGGTVKGVNVTASSSESQDLCPGKVIDGDPGTRWSSEFSDPQWIQIDLGKKTIVAGVVLRWETAYGKSYRIEVSEDEKSWKQVYSADDSDGGEDEIYFQPVSVRYVRMYGTERATPYGYSLFEIEILDNGLLPDNSYRIMKAVSSSTESGNSDVGAEKARDRNMKTRFVEP